MVPYPSCPLDKPMHLTTPAGIRYFIDQLPDPIAQTARLNPMYLYQEKLNLFFRKNITDPLALEAQLRSWFKTLRQPTIAQVREAMLLVIDEDYTLKMGGGSLSDQLYSSSLKWPQVHPGTGEDYEPVLIKKFSTNFTDVLITLEEITALIRQTLTSEEKKQAQQQNIQAVLTSLHRGYRYNLITLATAHGQSREVPFSDEYQTLLLNQLQTPQHWQQALELINPYMQHIAQQLHQFRSGSQAIGCPKNTLSVDQQATDEHIAFLNQHLQSWYQVKNTLIQRQNQDREESSPNAEGRRQL